MTLVVEDGTGLPDAESYLSVADASSYLTAYVADPSAWTGAAEAAQEAALRQATQYIDRAYDGQWQGNRAVATQRLSWPRVVVVLDGVYHEAEDIPRALIEATAEVALLILQGSTLFETTGSVDASTLTLDRTKIGDLEFEERYSEGGKTTADVKTFGKVEALLQLLLGDDSFVVRG